MVLIKQLVILLAFFLIISCDDNSGNKELFLSETIRSLSEKQKRDCNKKSAAKVRQYIFRNKSSLYGLIDGCGTVHIPPIYEEMKQAVDGIYLFRDENRYGYIDDEGNVTVPAVFEEVRRFSDHVAAVLVKDKYKWGYIDRTGAFVITPQFEEAYSFKNGTALVKIDGAYHLLKKSGERKRLLNANTTGFVDTGYYKNALYGSTVPGGDSINRTPFPPVFNIISQCGGKYIFLRDETLFLLNENGSVNLKKTIPGITEYRAFCSQKNNGKNAGKTDHFILVKNRNGKWGAVTKEGVSAIPAKYTDIYILSSDVAAVSDDEGDHFSLFPVKKPVSGKHPEFKLLKRLEDGIFAALTDKGRWFVFSPDGTRLNNEVYSSLTECTGCVAVAQKEKNETMYSIETNGKEITEKISAEQILHAFESSILLRRRHKTTDTIFTEIQDKKKRDIVFRKMGPSEIVKLYEDAALIRFLVSGTVMLVRENGSVLWMEKTTEKEKNIQSSGKQPAFTSISAGRYHTCAIDGKGKAWCWGSGKYGKLGNGDTEDRTVPTPVESSAIPKKTYLVSVVAGETHTCALSKKGAVFCWGDGCSGRLGDGKIEIYQKSTVPVSVDMSQITDKSTPISIHAGTTHSCLTYKSGNIYCWGAVKTSPESSLTTAVAEQMTFANTMIFQKNPVVSTGGYHSCLATTEKVLCQRNDAEKSFFLPPVSFDKKRGISKITSLSTGYSHTCFTTEKDKLYCFGGNMYDQTGRSDQMVVKEPVSVKRYDKPGEPEIHSVAAGGKKTCVLEKTGNVHCWGKIAQETDNIHHFRSYTSSPEQITDRSGKSLHNIVEITVGYDHACALDKKGNLFCWGSGEHGQLGNGINKFNYYENNAVQTK